MNEQPSVWVRLIKTRNGWVPFLRTEYECERINFFSECAEHYIYYGNLFWFSF